MTTLKINSQIILDTNHEGIRAICLNANTFVNPAYLSNELAGRSNWNTERILTTYRYEGNSLILSRGYMRDLLKTCQELDVAPEIIDERVFKPCEYPKNLIGVILRPYQARAVNEATRVEQGVLIAPTGSGKSLIGLEILRCREQKSLILVHRAELAKQWLAVIEKHLGIKAGLIGDGQWDIGNEITVALVQSLSAKENETKTLYNAFGLVLLDECHHAPSSSFFDVIGRFAAKFRYGLSATPQRRDGLEKLIYLAFGPVLSTIPKKEVEDMGATVPATVISIQTGFSPGLIDSWNEYIDALSVNADRNELIIDLAKKSNGAALVLVDRVGHASQLSEMLNRRGIDHVLAHGQLNKINREDVMERIRSAKLTVGTCSLLGEGLDISVWGTLIMGSPISSEIKLLQSIGRIVRPAPGKESAVVYDLIDDCAFSGGSFKKRFAIYKKHKIWVEFIKGKAARTSHAA